MQSVLVENMLVILNALAPTILHAQITTTLFRLLDYHTKKQRSDRKQVSLPHDELSSLHKLEKTTTHFQHH